MWMLPDLKPRDSHSLWYVPSRGHIPPPASINSLPPDSHAPNQRNASNQEHLRRTALHQLAKDELVQARRKRIVADWGCYYLKPPGVHKTLHQMREEKREMEEHQEAMRREQLAQELAEAAEGEAEGVSGEGMDDVQLDGAQDDLDDDVPDADFYIGSDDEEEDDTDSDDDDDEDEDEDEEEGTEDNEEDVEQDEVAIREERRNDLMTARMRMADDAFREALVRGDPDGDDMYGINEETQEEYQAHMLDEDDFVHSANLDGNMEADLDDYIPEAESGGYEHTDSEAEISSSSEDDDDDDEENESAGADQDGQHEGEDDEEDSAQADDIYGSAVHHHIGFAPRATPQGPTSPTPVLRNDFWSRSQMSRLAPIPRQSLGDMSSFLSQDESSFMHSSPAQPRRR